MVVLDEGLLNRIEAQPVAAAAVGYSDVTGCLHSMRH